MCANLPKTFPRRRSFPLPHATSPMRHNRRCHHPTRTGLFFSLSGLLMTNIALGVFAKKGAFGAVFFWNRRVLRLLPAILMLVAVIALVTVAQRAGLVGTPYVSTSEFCHPCALFSTPMSMAPPLALALSRVLRNAGIAIAIMLNVRATWPCACGPGFPGGARPTSEEQWFLYTDLMWALAYGENFNLIWRDNNYFADFQRASVMRHVWSLAVEEQ